MRRVLAALWLVCFGFGLSIPAGVASLRFCLLENRILVSGENAGAASADMAATCCCAGCDAKGEAPGDPACCLEFKKLPEATTPSILERIPPLPALEVPAFVLVPGLPAMAFNEGHALPAAPARAPDNPSTRRAVLSVWRI